MIRPADIAALQDAAAWLRRGELVAFPTETVYGLGANAWDAHAVAKIFAAKGRPATNPLIVHVASVDRLGYAISDKLPAEMQDLVQSLAPFWPGPLTIVVPRHRRIPDIVTAGLDTVGVRIPAHPVALALLNLCEFPVAAPSANPSNYVSPTCAAHVERELGAKVAMILDGGPCQAGIESTILSLVEHPPRVLRAGALSAEELADRLKLPVATLLRPASQASGVKHSAQSAPGQLPEHYSPHTPLVFAHEVDMQTLPSRVGRIVFRATSPLFVPAAEIVRLSDDGDLRQIARGLFAALRELDQRRLDLLIVDTCEEEGLGLAIMDRLRRARQRTRPGRADLPQKD